MRSAGGPPPFTARLSSFETELSLQVTTSCSSFSARPWPAAPIGRELGGAHNGRAVGDTQNLTGRTELRATPNTPVKAAIISAASQSSDVWIVWLEASIYL